MRTVKASLVGGVMGTVTLAGTLAGIGPARAATEPPSTTRIEAETYAVQRGTRVVADPKASGGRIVTQFSPGDVLGYDDVTTRGAAYSLLCFSTPAALQDGSEVGTVDVRFDSPWSKPVLSVPLRSWLGSGRRQWANAGPVPDGTRRVFLTIRQSRYSQPVNLDYLLFAATPPPPSLNC